MAKQGFATSDRRKVTVISEASHEVKVHDCGTVFVVMDASTAISVPSAEDCGEGWWCRFLVGEASGSECDITLGAGTIRLLNVSVDGTAGAVQNTDPGGNVITIDHDAGGAGDPKVGDEIEILVANGEWFVRALTDQ